MKKNITVLLHGELGNQLFQMALALQVAYYRKVKIRYLCLSNPSRIEDYSIPKELLIGQNNLIQKIYTSLTKKLYRIPENSRLRFIITIITIITRKIISLRYGRIYREKISHYYDKNLSQERLPLTIDGYFQSWQYFSEIKPEIQSAYSLKTISTEALDLLTVLPMQFTGIHIRRGNTGPAILNDSFHGLLPLSYYLRALKFLESRSRLFPIVVFTDNKPKCLDFMQDLNFEIYKVISPLEIKSQAENLHIMSKSASFIGANSSYSWWAAYLNKSDHADIIFPRPWYQNPGMPEQNLLVPDWISLGFESFIGEEK